GAAPASGPAGPVRPARTGSAAPPGRRRLPRRRSPAPPRGPASTANPSFFDFPCSSDLHGGGEKKKRFGKKACLSSPVLGPFASLDILTLVRDCCDQAERNCGRAVRR